METAGDTSGTATGHEPVTCADAGPHLWTESSPRLFSLLARVVSPWRTGRSHCAGSTPARHRVRYLPLVRKRWPAVAVAVVLAAFSMGCTATDTGTADTGSDTPSPVPASGSAAAPGAAQPPSSEQLQAALLELGDLPPGWTAVPGTADGELMPDFGACLGAPDAPGERLEEVASPAFSDERGNRVGSMLTTFSTHEPGVGDAALFGDPRAESCLTQVLSGEVEGRPRPAGAEVGTVQVTVTPGDGGGPGNVVATVDTSIPVVTVAGERLTLHVDFVFLAGRSTRGVIAFGGHGAQLPAELRGRVVATMAERLAAL